MTPSTKMNILLFALLLSIGLNIYELILLKSCTTSCSENENATIQTTGSRFCDNSGRYKPDDDQFGGIEMDATEAAGHIEKYRKLHENDKTMYLRTGFLYSKKVFDHIFNNEDTTINMVRLDLVGIEDPLSKKDSLFLIARGVKRKYSDVSYNTAKTSRIFINQSMCPKDCNNLSDLIIAN